MYPSHEETKTTTWMVEVQQLGDLEENIDHSFPIAHSIDITPVKFVPQEPIVVKAEIMYIHNPIAIPLAFISEDGKYKMRICYCMLSIVAVILVIIGIVLNVTAQS